MGSKYLSRIQIGKESTAGTAVAATTYWRGIGALQDERNVRFVPEDVGYLAGVDRTYTEKLLGAIGFEQTEATFEQIGYLLNAGVVGVAGVQDGAGSGYVYTHPISNTAAATPYTYTIEAGDGQQAEEMEYSFVKAIRLTGQTGQALMMAGDWVGRQVANTTFTGSLSLPSVEEIIMSKGKIYYDASGGTIGSTQKTGTLLKIAFELKTGFVERFTGDGYLYFSAHRMTRPEATLKVTFEHDAMGVLMKTDWRAESTKLIRLLWQGSALGTAGTYTYKTLQLDLAGKWLNVNKLGEDDGNSVVEGTFQMAYSSADALLGQFLVVNELSALP